MTYLINSIFYTLQGEGFWTGRPAVFVRFSRCNLWTGREEDRHKAVCQFCDTDFQRSERYTGAQLLDAVEDLWPSGWGSKMVVFTGGEPLLQVDEELVDDLICAGFYTAVETNGTVQPGALVDWTCISPKANTTLEITKGDELKLVYPQVGAEPERFEHLDFDHFWLSPMDGPDLADNTKAAVDYCLEHPRWRLNIQTHKIVGVP